MNAPGIAIFYGAFSRETCIAEIRPPVGGYVVLGAFEVIRPLKLLDLTAFKQLPHTGSMFRPGFREELARWRFLMGFHDIVSRPVQPHEEFLEYVPTQVVADYLANARLLDGVIYSSAQTGISDEEDQPDGAAESCNIALFNAEDVVEHPESTHARAEKHSQELDIFGYLWEPGPTSPPALRYIPDSVETVRVSAVRYRSTPTYIFTPDEFRTLFGPDDIEYDD